MRTASRIGILTRVGVLGLALAALLVALALAGGHRTPAVLAQGQSDNADLSGLSLNGAPLPDFESSRDFYSPGVANSVTRVTMVATPAATGAAMAYVPADADPSLEGHQMDLAPGANQVVITVTAPDGVATRTYTVVVGRSSIGHGAWQAAEDFNTLAPAGNATPYGLWSDGTTMWVTDRTDDKIYAYNMETKAREPGQDFDTLIAAGNNDPRGIWSNGETMWVADGEDSKLYAYNMATRARDPGKDLQLVGTWVGDPQGIWSDGTTVWVANSVKEHIFAYNLHTKERETSKDIRRLDIYHNENSKGIWSDGKIMWVLDYQQDKVFAYALEGRYPIVEKDFSLNRTAGNLSPGGMWSDGTTAWTVDQERGKIYAYHLPPEQAPAAYPPLLSCVSVDGAAVQGFLPYRFFHSPGVASAVERVTIMGVSGSEDAEITYTPPDPDLATAGHQVALAPGANVAYITVTASYTTETRTYTVVVGRESTSRWKWKAVEDFNTLVAANNGNPGYIWSDGNTMWVSDGGGSKIFAYNMATKAREPGKDFDTLKAAGNKNPTGIWSDGQTMWVADGWDQRIYAYNMATKARDWRKDFPHVIAKRGFGPSDIWSDGQTMWVVEPSTFDKVFAYNMTDKRRATRRDINVGAHGHSMPRGAWSDGETMWILDYQQEKGFAYRLANGSRDYGKDFDLDRTAGNRSPTGLWSDGKTAWVADPGHDKIYSYYLEPAPPSQPPARSSITVSGITAADYAENGAAPVATYSASGGAGCGTAWSLSGDDGGDFSISSAGELAFATPPDYENPADADADNVYRVTVEATDGAQTGTLDVAVTVTDLVDGITVSGPGAVDYAENGAAPVAAYAAPGGEANATITWSLSGDDGGDFSIGSAGELAFTAPPDYENPADADADNVYRVTVEASDGTYTATLDVTVTVTDVTGICDRTPQVRDAILALLPNVSDCELVTGADLDGITERLALNRQGITALKSGDFAGLSNVAGVDLINNALTALPEDIFQGLDAVRYVKMENNNLAALPEGLFQGLTNLQTVNLDNNDLTALPEGLFDGLSGLTSLSLPDNRVSALPEDIFDGLSNLEVLQMQGNEVAELPGEVFDGLSSLLRLRLNENALQELPAGVFAGLTSLNTLYLSGNPGAPFTLTVEAEQQGADAVVVKVAEGAPFDITVTVMALVDGSTVSNSATIPAGGLASEPVTISVDTPKLVPVDLLNPSFPAQGATYTGIELAVGDRVNMSLTTPKSIRLALAPTGTPGANARGARAAIGFVTVEPGTAIVATMSFHGLKRDFDPDDVEYVFRADVLNPDGADADSCEDQANGYGLGVARYLRLVYQDPEVRRGTISTDCPAGDYTLRATLGFPNGVELASSSAEFTVHDPQPSDDATLSGLALSGVDVGAFDSDTEEYTASVGNDVTETTVTATANDGGATYVIKLDGTEDADGKVALAVGDNTISVEVTAEDGQTTKTYTVTVARAETPLTARFQDVPAEHNGRDVSFRIAFSEPISVSFVTLQDHALEVTGGRVTYGNRVSNNDNSLWEVRVRPDSGDDLSIALPATLACGTPEAICTENGKKLSNRLEMTVPGPSAVPLTARFQDVPAEHNGSDVFSFRIAFSEPISISFVTLRDHALEVTGGRVIEAGRVNNNNDSLWEVRVRPGPGADVSIALPANRACDTREAICTVYGKKLSNRPEMTVPGPPAVPLTARFQDVPAEHNGRNVFAFHIAFSEPISVSYVTLHDHALEVTGGRVTYANRVSGNNDSLWEVRVAPNSDADVSIALPETLACGTPKAICTENGKKLSNRLEATVRGPDPLTARFREAPARHNGRNVFAFRIAFSEPISVSYVTLHDHALEVTGGRVTYANRVNGNNDSLWEIRVRPDSEADVSVALPATLACGTPEAICTAYGNKLSNRTEMTIPGPAAVSLTARFRDLPPAHHGRNFFTFRIAFSEPISVSYVTLHDHALEVTGGRVTYANRVSGNNDSLWEIRVAPDSDADVSITLPATLACGTPEAICTAYGKKLSNRLQATVRGPGPSAEPLTAQFREAPARHNGSDVFTFRIAFSEVISVSYATFRDHGLEVTGGRVTDVGRRYDNNDSLWVGKVQPDSDADVSIALPANRACNVQGAICTEKGKKLSNRPEMTIPGPAPANSPATGVPTISGTAQVGQTLTADASGIADADGLTNAVFSYRWVANDGSADTNITGATGATYTLAATDEGKTVKVRVTFSDDNGNEESLTSAATGAVAAPPSTDATLSSLTLSGVNFGTFDSATTDYTASVGNEVAETTVTPTVNDGGATYVIKLDGAEDADGTVDLAVGANTISVEVTAEDGQATSTYTVTVTRTEPPSTDATLIGLTLSGVDIGTFASATTDYTASVANEVAETTVTATTNDDGATYVIKLGGVEDADGTVALAVGDNAVTIEVTAEDGQTAKTYRVTVTRAVAPPSTNPAPPLTARFEEAPQSHNGTDPFTFRIAFSEAISTSYVVVRDHALEVTGGTVAAAGRVDGRNDLWWVRVQPDSDAYVSIALPADRACDTQGAVCTADEKELSNRPELAIPGPAPADAPVNSPATGVPTISGTAQVGQILTASTSGIADADGLSNASFSYRWVANDGSADTNITGATGATYTLAAADEGKTVKVRVSFTDDGGNGESLTSAATGAVAPPPSTDATLNGLTLSGVDIGTFTSATTDYTASVSNDVTESTVKPTVNDDGATYVINLDGAEDTDGTVPLAEGANAITIAVTAEDGQTTKTYTVTVTRAEAPPPASSDATLSGLALSGIDFGTFDPAITDYTASVENDVTETSVTATANDGGATYVIKLDGSEDGDEVITLAEGSNAITVEVTAEDGNTVRTYTVTVTRAEAPPPASSDATLSDLTLSGVDFGTFDSATTDYTASVGNDVTGTTVTATVNDGDATYVIKLDGAEDADGTVALAVGDNTITIEVTAGDGQASRTYTVTVTRAEAEPEEEPARDGPPGPPGNFTGEVIGKGQVKLDWDDVAGATGYAVQFYTHTADGWVQLPANDIGIVFNGSGATVSGLPDYDSYSFRVRARETEWSPGFLTLENPEQ